MQKSINLIIVVCLFVFCISPAINALQYFESPTGYYVGSYPCGVASADFNNDTIPDLVTANSAASTVSVLLGNGDGSFATHVDYSTGASHYPYFVDVGDMDGDGNVDIITGGTLGPIIFYGEGDGTFGTGDVYNISQQVLDVAVADFNNDSYPDFVSSHAVRDSVGIHINNHDSTYTTHFVPTGNGTISLAVGNLDGDNYTDILVGCSQGTVWYLKNNQSGSFIGSEVHIGNLSDPASVALSDFNGDNYDDFAVSHSVNDFLFTYFNDGDDTFTVGVGHVITDNPTTLEIADVNHDNEDDILLCIGTTNEVELYLNQGSGSFSYDTSFSIGGTPKDMIFADFDSDGYTDMGVTSYTTDQVEVFMSRVSLILSVDDIDTDGILPKEYSLGQNYPNPFNPETKVRFALPTASDVKIEVFNILGQSVMVLVDDYLTAGVKEITWNGINSSGRKVSSGIYFIPYHRRSVCRLQKDGINQIKRYNIYTYISSPC